MNGDLMLVIGLVVGVLAIPALLNAWTEGRAPRAGAIMVMIAIGLILAAWQTKPGGYRMDEIPDAFFSVLAQLVR